MALADKTCVPCKGGVPPLKGSDLDNLKKEVPEWGVSELAKTLGLAKSTTSEITTTLASQGLLTRTSTGRYRLGWRLFELSQILLRTSDFYLEAHDVMRELVSCWGETTSLVVLNGSQFINVERLPTSSRLQALLSQMKRPIPPYAGCIGKVLLAGQRWHEVTKLLETQVLESFTPNTITTLDRLAQELQQVRRQGFAYDREEVLQGVCGVSGPIFNLDGRVIAGMGLIIPADRFYSHQEHYAAIISKAAECVSEKLGYRAKKRQAPVFLEQKQTEHVCSDNQNIRVDNKRTSKVHNTYVYP